MQRYIPARAREGERIENEAMNEFLAAEAGSSVSGPAVSKKASPKRKSIRKYIFKSMERDKIATL